MTHIPPPVLSGGLTPAEIPYGYSAYATVFNDLRGYQPTVVGHELDNSSRQVIIVALSPGAYVRCTLVSAGWDVEQASREVVRAFTRASVTDVPACQAPDTGSARAPVTGPRNREA